MAAEETGIKSADAKKAKKPAPENGDKKTDDKVTTKPSAKPAKTSRPSLPGVWGIDLGQCALKAVRLDPAQRW